MRITSVTYRRLKSFGTYEHEALEATAEVGSAESPECALQDLQAWVCERIDAKTGADEAIERKYELESQISGIKRRLLAWREKYEIARAVLDRHGIPRDPEEQQAFVDDVPF